MGYDWRVTATKAAKNFGVTVGSVALAAVLAWIADPDHARQLVGEDALVPILTALATALLNWLKHRDEGAAG